MRRRRCLIDRLQLARYQMREKMLVIYGRRPPADPTRHQERQNWDVKGAVEREITPVRTVTVLKGAISSPFLDSHF